MNLLTRPPSLICLEIVYIGPSAKDWRGLGLGTEEDLHWRAKSLAVYSHLPGDFTNIP
jgi:hypothetical protein